MKNIYSKFQKKNFRAQGGFTIVETLVAVTILMIAIAGPLVVATKGLNTALFSKDQMIASYLAQESMEVIKNTRYNNLSSQDPNAAWLDDFEGCEANSRCDASAINGINSPNDCDRINGCRIYYSDANGYSHQANSGATPTIFFRSVYLEPIVDDDSGEIIPSEKKVNVFIKWSEGKIPYEIHLTSQIVDSFR